MPEYKRVLSKGGTYFFTVVTYQRAPIFNDEIKVSCLNKCIDDTIQDHIFNIEAIAILPDHIHTIWTLPYDDSNYSMRWMLIKKRFSINYSGISKSPVTESMQRKREQGIWQRRFWEHLIRDDEDFRTHCDYIHYNPVKHGLVSSPSLWKYSSFSKFVEKGYYAPNCGSSEPEKIHNINYE